MLHFIKITILGIAASLFSLAGAYATDPIQYWTKSNPTSTATIDHSRWDSILGKYIKPNADNLNQFDYAGVSADDKALLKAYLADLKTVAVTDLSKAEQRAYWINAYNAITVDLMLELWPIKSIRDTDTVLFVGKGPWDRKLFEVEGKVLTLNNIEHGILRPIWNDPRTHYAVNCASIGCPNLQNKAFTVDNMEDLLNKGAVEFINSPRGIQKFSKKSIRVSSIYSWFREDFGKNDAEVLAHFKKYAKGDVAVKLANVKRISGHDYDWKINKVR